jgi:glyoxylase-like metal-dependent hydrolase (beta-lactamase superfamily II)
MRDVIAPIRHLNRLFVSNVFLLDGGPGDRWLIDTGHMTERLTLLWELRRAGISPRDLTGVLLTHRHSDHAGNAAFLQSHYRIPIVAHQKDALVLAGEVSRPRLVRGEGNAIAGLFARVENAWPAPRVVVDTAIEGGDTIAGMQVHWVPGHTDGSVFYRHAPTKSLLSGDTLLTAHPPLTISRGIATPYPSYTTDMDLAHASLDAFHRQGFDYENLLAGHGPPLIGGARSQVLEFLERQDREAANAP